MKFVAIGNVAIDQNLQDFPSCGGSVLYSSLFASSLGLETIAITSFGKDFLKLKPSWRNVRVYSQLKPFSTTVGFIYDKKGNRQMILKKEGGILSEKLMPKEICDADIIFICPIVHEVSPELVSFIAKENREGIIVITAQGWLRDWKKEGDRIFQIPWDNAKEILRYTDILVISEEDIQEDKSALNLYKSFIKSQGIIIVTQGSKGTTAYRGKEIVSSYAYPAKAIDPTGAGDIFAVSFAIAWKETSSLGKSLKFANTAASFIIEGIGVSNIPTRSQIQSRSNKY